MLDDVGRGRGEVRTYYALNRVTVQGGGVGECDGAYSERVKQVFACPVSLRFKRRLTASNDLKGRQDY